MIIVEGADNVGKSTLIKQLVEMQPSLRLLHRDRFRPDRGESIATSYLRALMPVDGDRLKHSNGIIDRMFASECIYGKLFRDGCSMSEAEHLAVRMMLHSYNAMIVHCDPGDEAIQATWKEREQLYDRDPLKIANAYREFLPTIFAGFPVLRYNWTDTDAIFFRKLIIERHQLFRATQPALSRWSAFPYGLGNIRRPRIIIVVESSHELHGPFPLMRSQAGALLAWAITQAEHRLGHALVPAIYLTTADKRSVNSTSLLREEIRQLSGPQSTVVIALGAEAEASLSYLLPQLDNSNFTFAEMPRLHYGIGNRERYVTQLVNIINEHVPDLGDSLA